MVLVMRAPSPDRRVELALICPRVGECPVINRARKSGELAQSYGMQVRPQRRSIARLVARPRPVAPALAREAASLDGGANQVSHAAEAPHARDDLIAG